MKDLSLKYLCLVHIKDHKKFTELVFSVSKIEFCLYIILIYI